MKSSTVVALLSLTTSTVLAAAADNTVAAATVPGQEKWPKIFRENPVKRTPILVDTEYGEIQWGEFISLMEATHSNRNLQDGAFGNNPNQCNADGEFFVCNTENFFTQGNNQTQVAQTIRCELDSAVGFDFQARPEVCTCSAVLTEGSRVRNCGCAVCPYGRAQATALDCSMVTDDPYVAGPCTSLDCDGRCNGTGAAVVNQPTPAPADAAEPGAAPTDSSSGVNALQMVVGLLVGTAVSFVSVYWV